MLRSLRIALLLAATAAVPAIASSDGSAVNLERYAGKVVLLDFWASWCAPCAQSFPWMAEMLEKHGPEGLIVVAVGLDEDPEAATRFLRDHPLPFEHVSDPSGKIALAFGVQAMPTSILFDRQGRPAFVHTGFHPEARGEYEQQMVDLLEGRAQGDPALLSRRPARRSRLGVRPWERGILARDEMALGSAPLDLAIDDHIYFSKEASSGGRGFGGGGCGCN